MEDDNDPFAPAELLKVRPLYPALIDSRGHFILTPVAELHDDPEQASEEADAAKLQERARGFAQSLIDAVPTIERIKLAAPPPLKRLHKPETRQFNWRHPAWIDLRHTPFKECVERRFANTASRLGYSAQYANTIRAELLLIYLTRGEAPPFSVVDGRLKYPKADEGMLAAVIFPVLWQAHERALVEAERRSIRRDEGPSPLLSNRGKLLAEMFKELTAVKTIGQLLATRSMLKTLGTLIDACRAEIRP